jgi:hypothetical protein
MTFFTDGNEWKQVLEAQFYAEMYFNWVRYFVFSGYKIRQTLAEIFLFIGRPCPSFSSAHSSTENERKRFNLLTPLLITGGNYRPGKRI